MKTFLRPALGAVLVLVVAACADPSGQPWTPPPAGSVAPETQAPASAAPSAAASVAPSAAASVAPSAGASVAPSAAASVAPSVAASVAPSVAPETGTVTLEFNADGQLQRDGAKVTDIPVVPGETTTFVITNSSGKPHNFYIGPSQQLLLGMVDGLTGIPEWSDAEPKELAWDVPADIAGLKFASTVGSDYGATNGTFSVVGAATPVPATPAPASAAPSAAASAPAGSQEPGGRVIELELDGALQIKQNGQKVTDIPVTPGETIVFKLNNTAGYPHNFWIGTDQELSVPNAKTSAGVPDWSTGVQEFTWVVPDDVTGLKFGCTVPGHYSLMQGTFSPAT